MEVMRQLENGSVLSEEQWKMKLWTNDWLKCLPCFTDTITVDLKKDLNVKIQAPPKKKLSIIPGKID